MFYEKSDIRLYSNDEELGKVIYYQNIMWLNIDLLTPLVLVTLDCLLCSDIYVVFDKCNFHLGKQKNWRLRHCMNALLKQLKVCGVK